MSKNTNLRACSSKAVEQPVAPFSEMQREDSGSTPDMHKLDWRIEARLLLLQSSHEIERLYTGQPDENLMDNGTYKAIRKFLGLPPNKANQ